MGSTSCGDERGYDVRRYRALARSLHARVYATADQRLLLVRGEPDFERLLDSLSRMREIPPSQRSPRPAELGFPDLGDGELTPHGLNVRGRALVRWSRALDAEERRSRPNKRRARQIQAERREIERLRTRLAELHEWRRKSLAGMTPEGAPFLLEQVEDEFLRSRVCPRRGICQQPTDASPVGAAEAAADANANHSECDECSPPPRCLAGAASGTDAAALPPLACWMGRVVLWAAGRNALLRYLDVVSPLARPRAEFEHVARLRSFVQQLHTWEHRSRTEAKTALHDELREAVKSLCPRVVTKGKLGSRLRGRSFAEHCDLLIERSQKLLLEYRDVPLRRVPAAMAALSTCDGATSPLPQRLVRRCLETGDHAAFDREVRALYVESGKKKYAELLAAVERLELSPDPSEYAIVRSMLAGGAALDDIAWAQREDLLGWFERPCLSVAWLRSFLKSLHECGVQLDGSQLAAVLQAVDARKDIAVFDRFVRWLGRFSTTTLSPRARTVAAKALAELVAPAVEKLGCHERLHRWASPATTGRSNPRHEAAELRPVADWLRGIAFYQQMAGQAPSLRGRSARSLARKRRSPRSEPICKRPLQRAGQAVLKRLGWLI